jgi:serine/threonine protein kinase
MLGGRIRGQGTYGCIFQPALKCRGKKGIAKGKQDPTMVGKITSKLDAKNEVEIASLLNKLPDYNKYVIVSTGEVCIPKVKQDEKDLGQCKFSSKLPIQETRQLMMPWGGYALNRINLDPYVFNFYKFMEDILACGTFLVLNDLCHFDIYGQNMLFDSKNTPRLIDFGFSFQPSKLKLDDLPNRWRQLGLDYDTESPEVSLMLGTHSRYPLNTLISTLGNINPVVHRLQVLCNVNVESWKAGLLQWAQESSSFQNHDWLSCWKVYWPGFDAWAIGATLLIVLEIQLSFPSFLESTAWKEKGSKIKSILINLCKSHPKQRFDCAEALSVLTDGAHPLISSGSDDQRGAEWVSEKRRIRSQN